MMSILLMIMSKLDNKICINGILLVNKPVGLTSNAVLQKVKRLYNAKKAGHTGSLDPLATGMLPICFGEATKICQYLLDADKSYIATGLLGIKTTTGDAEGEIIHKVDNICISETQLIDSINQFTGPIQQIPSMFSALKHQGTPLYKYAREGKTIDRKSRDVLINSIQLLDFNGLQFTIRVSCSKGTYIRNLVEDIGENLGVHAHVISLHRLYTAGFANEQMYTLMDLQELNEVELSNCLLPLERAINYLPIIKVSDDEAIQLKHGKTITNKQGITGSVRIHDSADIFMGLGEVGSDCILKVKRLLAQIIN